MSNTGGEESERGHFCLMEQVCLRLLKGLILVQLHFFPQRASSAKLSAKALSVGCPGVDMLMLAPTSSKRST